MHLDFFKIKRNFLALYLGFKAAVEPDHLKAIQLYERIRTLEDENDTLARSGLAWSYHKLGDDTKAIYYGNQVLSINPYDVLILKLLIGIYFHKKEYAIVHAYVLRTLSAMPNTEIEKVKSTFTRWLDILMPRFNRIPKLRHRLHKIEQVLKDDNAYESEWLCWAEDFKKWYEDRLKSGGNPIPPVAAWN